jgi:hypothetical protein
MDLISGPLVGPTHYRGQARDAARRGGSYVSPSSSTYPSAHDTRPDRDFRDSGKRMESAESHEGAQGLLGGFWLSQDW